MTTPANVSSYRDRHGKLRWRYRKAGVCIQLPGQPGEEKFSDHAKRAAAGLIRQQDRSAHPSRTGHLTDFAKTALARARQRAAEKGVPFTLTLNDVNAVMENQMWHCPISGVQFFQTRRSERAFQPTIDRINPAAGYVAGNIRIVAYIVNVAMNQWGEAALWKLVEAMANRLPGRQPIRNGRKTRQGSPISK